MISLTNAYLADQNKPPMGWVNPFLYQYSSNFFSDVTSGSNRGLESNSTSMTCYVCQYGYYAGVGWDPVTGLGILNLQSFMYMASNTTAARPPSSTPSSTATWVIVVAVIGALIVLVSLGYWCYTKRRTVAATTINTSSIRRISTTTTTETRSPLQHKV